MPDTELAKRLLAVKANCSEDSSGTRWALVDCWLLEEAAAALSAAREREARYAVYMTDKADQLWQQAQAEAMEWQPIAKYPRCEQGWGPEVLVRCPSVQCQISVRGDLQPLIDVGETAYVAHLEADMWLTRSGDDPIAWSDLPAPPSEFMFFGERVCKCSTHRTLAAGQGGENGLGS